MSRIATTMAEAASQGRRRHRRFALALIGTFSGVLLFFAFVNTWINPLWVTSSPWTDESFAPYRQIYRNTRTAKAGLLRVNDWDIVMMGSSRVAIAMDPTLPEWGEERKVLNLGLSASTLTENKLVVDYVLKHNPSVKHLIVGVDLTDISSRSNSTASAGFNESPFNPKGDVMERELRYVFGVSSFRASARTWQTKRKGETPPYTVLGHWAHHRSHGIASVRKMIETGTIPGAKRFAAARKVRNVVNPARIELLEEMMKACRNRGVRLTLLVPPNHVAYMAVPVVDGAQDPMLMGNRRAMAEVVKKSNAEFPDGPRVELWDFGDFHPLNGEALPPLDAPKREMHYWVDGIHAKETLGHIMLARMLGWPLPDPAGADYGVRLDLIEPAENERRIKEQFARYKETRPEDWAWIEAKIHSSDADAKKDDEEE